MQDKNVKYLTNEKNESMKEKEFFIKKKKAFCCQKLSPTRKWSFKYNMQILGLREIHILKKKFQQ